MKSSVINWFEIPAQDFQRAVTFYQNLFKVELKQEQMGEMQLGVFPGSNESAEPADKAGENCVVNGCVCLSPWHKPASTGTVIYLNCAEGVDSVLGRVLPQGGQILREKTALPPGLGYFALMRDTEGNVVGLHGLQ